MKNYSLIFAFSTLVLVSLACQTLAPQASPLPTQPKTVQKPIFTTPPKTEEQVPRISVYEAKTALDTGQAILIDVRAAEFYAEGHALGAISIPLAEFEYNLPFLPLEKDQWIITYCT